MLPYIKLSAASLTVILHQTHFIMLHQYTLVRATTWILNL